MTFEIGDRVKMTRGNNVYLGEISTVNENIRMAVVSLDNGQFEKVSFDYLELYEETNEAPDDVISISRAEFIKRCKDVLIEQAGKDWTKTLYYLSALEIIDAELAKMEYDS